MELQRHLNLPELLDKKPFFLFGPRATGKSIIYADSKNGICSIRVSVAYWHYPLVLIMIEETVDKSIEARLEESAAQYLRNGRPGDNEHTLRVVTYGKELLKNEEGDRLILVHNTITS